MRLVQTIERNELSSYDWGIYELTEEESKKYGNKFALSQGLFSDHALKNYGTDKLLALLQEFRYEGLFETQKEAYLHVKLVEMKCKIDRLEYAIKTLIDDTENLKTPTW